MNDVIAVINNTDALYTCKLQREGMGHDINQNRHITSQKTPVAAASRYSTRLLQLVMRYQHFWCLLYGSNRIACSRYACRHSNIEERF